MRKAIHTAGGESGAAVIAEIHRVLREDGELITAERVRTQEGVNLLGRLFFSLGQTPTCEQLRAGFAIDRRWPMLEARAVFDQIIREGVTRGAWCLFRLADEQHTRPDVIYSRDTEALPPELDLRTPGWAIVTPCGCQTARLARRPDQAGAGAGRKLGGRGAFRDSRSPMSPRSSIRWSMPTARSPSRTS